MKYVNFNTNIYNGTDGKDDLAELRLFWIDVEGNMKLTIMTIALAFLVACGGNGNGGFPPPQNPYPVEMPAAWTYSMTTPGGVAIQSAVDVPMAAQLAIDEGITNQITRINAAHPDWAVGRSLSEYRVGLIKGTLTNTNPAGSPALSVRGVQSAGTVIGVGNDFLQPQMILLPHQAATNWAYLDYLMRSAWHESEHVREFNNDQGNFYYYVQPGMDVHPHYP